MNNTLKVILLFTLSTSVLAKDLSNQNHVENILGVDIKELRTHFPEIFVTNNQMNISLQDKVNILFPKDIDQKNKQKVLVFLRKINDLCPQCSNGPYSSKAGGFGCSGISTGGNKKGLSEFTSYRSKYIKLKEQYKLLDGKYKRCSKQL